MTETTILLLIFGITSLFALAVFSLLQRGQDTDTDSEEPARRMFGPLTPAIGGMVPSSQEGRESVQNDLWLAGYYQPAAIVNFYALRAVLVVLPLALGLGAVLVSDTPKMALTLGSIAFGAAVLGYAMPRIMLGREAKTRAERLRRGVPMFMDTLGLCLSTGSGLLESFRRSGDAIQRGYPDLSQDIRIVHRQSQLRSMEHALDQWRRRTPLPEVGSLCFLLSQSERLGTDVTKGLWELSSSYRVNARQSAEAAANRTNFYLLFPTVLCLLMAAGIILVGPGIVKMYEESQRIAEEVDKVEKSKNDINSIFEKQPKPKPVPSTNFIPPDPSRN
ncbi:MAG: type II secretion system F family protein [Gemmataceae bacterium]